MVRGDSVIQKGSNLENMIKLKYEDVDSLVPSLNNWKILRYCHPIYISLVIIHRLVVGFTRPKALLSSSLFLNSWELIANIYLDVDILPICSEQETLICNIVSYSSVLYLIISPKYPWSNHILDLQY